ncbi:hypothetical protein vseg_010139 [Gypsophila vaccaria]
MSKLTEYSVVISRTKKIYKSHKCYDFIVVSEYCPNSIYEYLNAPKHSGFKIECDDLRNNARKHLSALGWKFWSKIKGSQDEWRYVSPNSTYYSLKTACQAIADGKEVNTIDSLGSDFVENGNVVADQLKVSKSSRISRKQKRNEDVGDENLVSKKRRVLDKVREGKAGEVVGEDTSRVLRSSKRVRQVGGGSSSVSKNPRTVLSWMIENNAVAPRSRVFYCKKKCVDEPLAEGRVFREGIRCGCCENLFSLSGFQAHVAGNNVLRPAENLFLEDGRSLVSCQVELMKERLRSFCREGEAGNRPEISNDYVCSICQYGGDLIMCDRCPSTYHADCLNLPCVPEGEWFCPLCCCAVCGDSQFDDNALSCYQCYQCERRYHSCCKEDRGMAISGENWFCCNTCEMVHWGIQQLLGKPILVGHDGLTCTLVKPTHNQAEDDEDSNLAAMAEIYSRLGVALEVMHECFEAVKDSKSGQDLVEDALFCRGSRLNRLNFKGCYTVLLERNDELITVAILRIFGDKVAEIPLIGTRFQHRRRGMCRILMNEIEKSLRNLGVQKLVLPAAPSVLDAWTNSFGFTPLTKSDRSEFIGYTLWDFQHTTMCQKLLRKPPSPRPYLSRDMSGIQYRSRQFPEKSGRILEHKGKSKLHEVSQEDQDQETDIVGGDLVNGDDNCRIAPPTVVTSTVPIDQADGQPLSSTEFTDGKRFARNKGCQTLKFYRRKPATEVELRPPVPEARYSLSCTPSIYVKLPRSDFSVTRKKLVN